MVGLLLQYLRISVRNITVHRLFPAVEAKGQRQQRELKKITKPLGHVFAPLRHCVTPFCYVRFQNIELPPLLCFLCGK
jgi:predicted Zn-dependent protease